jgi:Flp pilus assembly protein TadG
MPGKTEPNQQKQEKSRGQSLVEMALLLPILLVLVLGALEFGRLFYTKIVITNAAREGVYYLSLNPTDYANGTAAAQAEADNSGIPDITVVITPKNSGGYTSIEMTVTTQVDGLLLLRFLGNPFSITTNQKDFVLSSSVEMMVQ